MPEIKHNFASGKMNKDVDERLVPKGEYRHATNVQVTTSEDSEVDTCMFIASLYCPFGTSLSSRSLFILPPVN